MKLRFILVAGLVFLVQAALMFLVWGSPAQVTERSFTPTPSNTPPIVQPGPTGTPIPTLIPAFLAAPTQRVSQVSFGGGQCEMAALDLIGAWVKAGKPESEPFDFTTLDGKACQASFLEVAPLFTQPNIWFAGAIACATCHGTDIKLAAANLSLVDYKNILLGTRRAESAAGQDILGNASSWEQSKLYDVMVKRLMPMGRPFTSPEKGPTVKVGTLK
jgi:hypothetical protein